MATEARAANQAFIAPLHFTVRSGPEQRFMPYWQISEVVHLLRVADCKGLARIRGAVGTKRLKGSFVDRNCLHRVGAQGDSR